MALTTPSTNSYRRIRPHSWSGAFRCWGLDNREASVRVPSDITVAEAEAIAVAILRENALCLYRSTH
ncbi:hypothetical protein NUACC26_095650 [Scytonema sp. NUACC26]